jgi:hypothetical protein
LSYEMDTGYAMARQASRITRFVAAFPLDVAADAGALVGIHRLAGEHGIKGRS